jgi:hypothetical protein
MFDGRSQSPIKIVGELNSLHVFDSKQPGDGDWGKTTATLVNWMIGQLPSIAISTMGSFIDVNLEDVLRADICPAKRRHRVKTVRIDLRRTSGFFSP